MTLQLCDSVKTLAEAMVGATYQPQPTSDNPPCVCCETQPVLEQDTRKVGVLKNFCVFCS